MSSKLIPAAMLLKMRKKSSASVESKGECQSAENDCENDSKSVNPPQGLLHKQLPVSSAPSSSSKSSLDVEKTAECTSSSDLDSAMMSLFALRSVLEKSQQEKQQQENEWRIQEEQQREVGRLKREELQSNQGQAVNALKGLLSVGAKPAPEPAISNNMVALLQRAATHKAMQYQVPSSSEDLHPPPQGVMSLLLKAAQKKQQQSLPPPTSFASVLQQAPKLPAKAANLVNAAAKGVVPNPYHQQSVVQVQKPITKTTKTAVAPSRAEKLKKVSSSGQLKQSAQPQPPDHFAGSSFLSSPDPNFMPLPDFGFDASTAFFDD